LFDNKKKQIQIAQVIYKKVLEDLGFESGLGWREGSGVEGGLPGHCLKEHWKVTVNASTGYEVSLNLDADLQFMNITERNLSWVHTTIFHGHEVSDVSSDNINPYNFSDDSDKEPFDS
jgi:hypothetical protein